jgi:hypothetical protein
MSIRIAVVNDGTRGASALHLYVRTVDAINYHKPTKWVSLDNQLYHRTIQTPLFANDTMWIKALIVSYALADKNRELRYRIAYEEPQAGCRFHLSAAFRVDLRRCSNRSKIPKISPPRRPAERHREAHAASVGASCTATRGSRSAGWARSRGPSRLPRSRPGC